MGFPRFWGKVSPGEDVVSPDVGEGKRDEVNNRPGNARSGNRRLIWTIAYYGLLIVGATLWWKFLWLLTESDSSLTKF